MTENNEQNNNSQTEEHSSPSLEVETVVSDGETAELAQDEKAHTNTTNSPQPKNKKSKSKKAFWLISLFSLLLVVLVFSAGVYFIWQEKNKNAQQLQTLETLQAKITETQAMLLQLDDKQADLLTLEEKRDAEQRKRLLVVEQRIQAQHKKLQSMSSTSREDWLLAEAEYLLRLANQRVLIERSPRSADALLSEADDILKNLADPDLFSLRQAIANDLAQLRLVKKIDQEGIYFSLKALAAQLDNLNMRATRQELMAASNEPEQQIVTTENNKGVVEDKSFWKKLGSSFKETFSFMNNYVRFTDHSEAPPALLPPDSAAYLKQNLRLKIERAQLALLREEQKIYESSLTEAIDWLAQYYPDSAPTQSYIKQITDLREKNIVQILPDITYSLELLHEYIENLHQLKGAQLNSPRDPSKGEAL